ncbi:glycosyl hydrolase family 8 [Acuticoccus sp. M5D2P5]|uniref:glycosyl hydrolase family 8 n=1 Tax=Acuticoccus kalidii TaxID=2910977 RepID=UPI001F1604F4|nr:glycosyl hydrolase family 8 [Acuticoccus kalidii]MCF3935278.1 glycosyl hydrolase family 8 [Acuticoccus kalidii]
MLTFGSTFQTWTSEKFAAFKAAFVRPDGRVVDAENRSISHSEGQGYAMLFAVQANNERAFQSIWRFTETHLQRSDALFSWRYDPASSPHITDPNNATDGDLLIATALALADIRWGRPEYRDEAARIAETIRRKLIVKYKNYTLLLPGVEGFLRDRFPFAEFLGINQQQSPIINLSYWIYISFTVLNMVDPSPVWNELRESGLRLLTSTPTPPTEWSVISEEGQLEPAPGRPAEFGYNAVRIPLYLLVSGYRAPYLHRALLAVWGAPSPRAPFVFHHTTGSRIDHMDLAGFRLIHEIIYCGETGRPINQNLLYVEPQTYFSTSIYLIALNVLYTYQADCFPSEPGP